MSSIPILENRPTPFDTAQPKIKEIKQMKRFFT